MDPDEVALTNLVAEESGVEIPKETPEPEKTQEPEAPKTEAPEGQPGAEAPPEAPAPESPAPEQKTPSEPKEAEKPEEPLKTETPAEPVKDWRTELPPPPKPYEGPEPEMDPETGQLTNMTAVEYAQYIKASSQAEWRTEMYNQHVQNRALDEAEKILPQIKSDQRIRSMVQNLQIASVIDGKQIDAFEAATQVRDLLQGAKAEGAQNTKASIVVQKNAALESGAGEPQTDNSKNEELAARINRNEPEAFQELMADWIDKGVI